MSTTAASRVVGGDGGAEPMAAQMLARPTVHRAAHVVAHPALAMRLAMRTHPALAMRTHPTVHQATHPARPMQHPMSTPHGASATASSILTSTVRRSRRPRY